MEAKIKSWPGRGAGSVKAAAAPSSMRPEAVMPDVQSRGSLWACWVLFCGVGRVGSITAVSLEARSVKKEKTARASKKSKSQAQKGISRERDSEESKMGLGLCRGARQRKRQSWDARWNQTTALFLLVVIVLFVYLVIKKGGAF